MEEKVFLFNSFLYFVCTAIFLYATVFILKSEPKTTFGTRAYAEMPKIVLALISK